MNKISESMNFDFEFISPMEVDFEESAIGVALVKGTLLSEGISRNGNLYTLDQMGKIASSAEGVPIYYGTMNKRIDGVNVENAHANIEPHRVGEIMKTWIEESGRKIKFIAKIFSTDLFPHLVEEIKQGWGVSIGGKGDAQYIIDSMKRVLTKVFNLTVNHVQLLRPETPRGQEEAQIECADQKEFQESMLFHELPEPNFKVKEIRMREGDSVTFSI
jgi:hypothetical protein